MTLPHLLPFIACCVVCVCVCVAVCERDSWDTLLSTGLALPHLIRPFSCFSLACNQHCRPLMFCRSFRVSPLFSSLFSLLVAPISISLFFKAAHCFHHCSFATVPQSLSSPFCGIVSQKPVCGILLRALSHRQLSEKLLLKALRGAATWPTVIPKQPFIHHAILVSVPLSVQLEDLWHLMGGQVQRPKC